MFCCKEEKEGLKVCFALDFQCGKGKNFTYKVEQAIEYMCNDITQHKASSLSSKTLCI